MNEGELCNLDSDCCDSQMFFCQNYQTSAKRCTSRVNLFFSSGPCNDINDCQSDPPSSAQLFCDLLNKKPDPAKGGMCVFCLPQGFKYDGSVPCCSGFVQEIDGEFYCLDRSDVLYFYNWTKFTSEGDDRTFLGPSDRQANSGRYSLLAYYNTGTPAYIAYQLNLSPNSVYLLEFYSSGNTNPRFAIYDQFNDAYFVDFNHWIRTPINGYEEPVIHTVPATSSFTKNQYLFNTLSNNVSSVQLRFYPPESDDGSSYFIDDVSLSKLNSFSIMFWIKNSPLGGEYNVLSQNSEEGGFGFRLEDSGGFFYFDGTDVNGYPVGFNTDQYYFDNNWHHVAFVFNLSYWNSNYFRFYVDGRLIQEGQTSMIFFNSSSPLIIGKNNEYDSFTGKLDDLRIYQRALSEQEIYDYYHFLKAQKDLNITIFGNFSTTVNQTFSYYNAILSARQLLADTVLSFSFDELPVEGKVLDSSKFSSFGILDGAVWTAQGKFQGAYLFNGSGSKINLSSQIFSFGKSDFTISAWINPNSSTTSTCGPNAVFTAGSAGIWNENGYLSFTLNKSFGGASGSVFSSLLNKWTHIAAVRKGGKLLLYENGQLTGSVENENFKNFNFYPSSVSIGSSYSCPSNSYTFSGKIDQFQVFSRALTEDEIIQLSKDSQLIYQSYLQSK
jgi:hypothetical protein